MRTKPSFNRTGLYFGEKSSTSEELSSIESLQIIDSLDSKLDLEKYEEQLQSADFIFYDLKQTSIDPIKLIEKAQQLTSRKTISIAISEGNLNQKYLAMLLKFQLHDIFVTPLQSEAISERLQFLSSHQVFAQKEPAINHLTQVAQFRVGFFKRSFDVFFSFFALLFLSPILLFTAIAIKIDSPGPVFFSSQRVGASYKIFSFFKFRSMKVGAANQLDNLQNLNQYQKTPETTLKKSCPECVQKKEPCSPILIIDNERICENQYQIILKSKQSSFIKLQNDPRVTNLGKFIRKTSIDELPQLYNILRGDMSFVGNRPLPLYEAEQLTTDDWAERFMAPAGLTGLWQVRKRGKSEMSEAERKRLDNSYAKHRSFLGDLSLIFKTIPVLLQKADV